MLVDLPPAVTVAPFIDRPVDASVTVPLMVPVVGIGSNAIWICLSWSSLTAVVFDWYPVADVVIV